MTIKEAIEIELKKLSNRKISCREIAKITGIEQTRCWRVLSNTTLKGITLREVDALEAAGLINPMDRLIRNSLTSTAV